MVAAARLVRTGRVFDLAHVLHADVPAFPGRTFTQVLQPYQEPVGTNRVHWVVEQITATQQMGTHVDGRGHLHEGDRTYNGHRLADIRTRYGTSRLGIDTLHCHCRRCSPAGCAWTWPPSAAWTACRPAM